MQKFSTRYGCVLPWGWLLPAVPTMAGFIAVSGLAPYPDTPPPGTAVFDPALAFPFEFAFTK